MEDNGADRELGGKWERGFCVIAGNQGKAFTPQQIGRTQAASWWHKAPEDWRCTLLPDITIWTAPGEHHEIKHKNPTRNGRYYGLEEYRLKALVDFRLLTQQPVLYTIHDWEHAGASHALEEMPNRLQDWFTVDVLRLQLWLDETDTRAVPMPTYVNGERDVRPGFYWPTTLWWRLSEWWRLTEVF